MVTQCTVPGTVAVTFDDGPFVHFADIVNQFNTAGGRATFFLNGRNWGCVYDYADAIVAAVADGHQIASHTFSHPDMTTLTFDEVVYQMTKLDGAFEKILGYSPTYMRPPFGYYTAATNVALQSVGFRYNVMWDLDSNDWGGGPMSAETGAYDQASTTVPHIALNHEVYEPTASQLVPYIISWARARNLSMVTVGECLGDPPELWYKNYGAPQHRDATWVCW